MHRLSQASEVKLQHNLCFPTEASKSGRKVLTHFMPNFLHRGYSILQIQILEATRQEIAFITPKITYVLKMRSVRFDFAFEQLQTRTSGWDLGQRAAHLS